jgi:hypothetical protein
MALPQLAAAETVVPPGNSAVIQYTEVIPSAGGGVKSGGSIDAPEATPAKVLGKHKAQQLESKGSVGHEVADLVAETAPTTTAAQTGGGSAQAKPAKHHKKGKGEKQSGKGEGEKSGAAPAGGGSEPPQSSTDTSGSGSSGLGEILAQATGSSSGNLGLFLPLIIIGTVIWSVTYATRQRRQVG